jgi:hypothetical protein
VPRVPILQNNLAAANDAKLQLSKDAIEGYIGERQELQFRHDALDAELTTLRDASDMCVGCLVAPSRQFFACTCIVEGCFKVGLCNDCAVKFKDDAAADDVALRCPMCRTTCRLQPSNRPMSSPKGPSRISPRTREPPSPFGNSLGSFSP